jgi:hypothetical protein
MAVGTLRGDGEAGIAREPDQIARLTAENASLRAERDRLAVRCAIWSRRWRLPRRTWSS